MEIIDKLNSLIDRLEMIQRDKFPNINNLRVQIDIIKNKELPQLMDEAGEFDDVISENESDNSIKDQIDDLFFQAEVLINTICLDFGIENREAYNYTGSSLEDDDEDDDEEDDEEDNDNYDIVLNEVSKSALKAIGLDKEDEQSINLMRAILIGISSEESDDTIAERAFAQLAMSGFMLPMDDIKEMCRKTRETCKKQLFGLQIAINSLCEYNCSALDALSQIKMFL